MRRVVLFHESRLFCWAACFTRASTTSKHHEHERERERERGSPSTTDARAEQKNVKAAGGGAFGDKGFGAKARWLRAKALVKEEDVEREVM